MGAQWNFLREEIPLITHNICLRRKNENHGRKILKNHPYQEPCKFIVAVIKSNNQVTWPNKDGLDKQWDSFTNGQSGLTARDQVYNLPN